MARELRKQVRAAQDAEHRSLANAAAGSKDRSKSQKLAALGDRAAMGMVAGDAGDEKLFRPPAAQTVRLR